MSLLLSCLYGLLCRKSQWSINNRINEQIIHLKETAVVARWRNLQWTECLGRGGDHSFQKRVAHYLRWEKWKGMTHPWRQLLRVGSSRCPNRCSNRFWLVGRDKVKILVRAWGLKVSIMTWVRKAQQKFHCDGTGSHA